MIVVVAIWLRLDYAKTQSGRQDDMENACTIERYRRGPARARAALTIGKDHLTAVVVAVAVA